MFQLCECMLLIFHQLLKMFYLQDLNSGHQAARCDSTRTTFMKTSVTHQTEAQWSMFATTASILVFLINVSLQQNLLPQYKHTIFMMVMEELLLLYKQPVQML
jgi:hypothetical protein